MKHKILLVFAVMALSVSCSSKPSGIPEGQWKYDLVVNGVKAGMATFSNSSDGNSYVTRSEMFLNIGTIENSSVQVVTETIDFKPVKLETVNTVKDKAAGSSQIIKKTALFKGKEVTLESDGYKSKITIDEPFYLDGNFFFSEMLKHGFKTGLTIKAYIYEPSVEIDTPILVIYEVKGFETVSVGNRSMKLMHIKQRVEKLKSVDIYINSDGVTEKIVLKMLNNIFEMIRVQ